MIPPGPYRIELTYDLASKRRTPPYVIVGADGRTIAGHIDDRAAAEMIVDRLNHPVFVKS